MLHQVREMVHDTPFTAWIYCINQYTSQVSHTDPFSQTSPFAAHILTRSAIRLGGVWVCMHSVHVLPSVITACLSPLECVMHTWKGSMSECLRMPVAYTSIDSLVMHVECILTLQAVIKLCSAVHGGIATHIIILISRSFSFFPYQIHRTIECMNWGACTSADNNFPFANGATYSSHSNPMWILTLIRFCCHSSSAYIMKTYICFSPLIQQISGIDETATVQ